MSIYVGAGRINYPAMRGPCPYGFHVPTSNECKAIGTILTTKFGMASDWTTPKTYLKMPAGGYRANGSGNVTNQGTTGRYFCCTPYNSLVYIIYFTSSVFYCGTSTNQRSMGMLIRPFKDEPVKPTSSWTTIYDGSSVASGAGIFHNASSGLISISDDGTNWITIADKNLGATTICNDGDTLSEANCGKYFQRGNNYPFPRTGSVTTSTTKVDASAYGPGNWYYSSTYITASASPYDRSLVQNDNLRGGVVGRVKTDVKDICVGAGIDDYSAMQGPCPDGFHVPMRAEWTGVVDAGVTLGARQSGTSGTDNLISKLHLPKAGCIWENTGNYTSGYGYYRCCTSFWSNSRIYFYFLQLSNLAVTGGVCNRCQSIRPFKDIPVSPDSTWTTIHQGTGGAGIFWSKGLGLISISSDGTTWYTIADKNLGANVVYNSGDTLSADNCGGFFQGGNNYMFPWGVNISTKSGTKVDPVGFGPGNYYSSSTFITATSWISTDSRNLRGWVTGIQKKGNVKQAYMGTTPVRPTYNPGVYRNKAKGLISISKDGKNWITIADKNVGAKAVYNYGDTLSQDNCGYYYQWGNNYGFPWTGSLTTSTARVDASAYGPTNPYYGSTFRKYSGDWSSSVNRNLRGQTTNTLVARQGPCPEGFHVPTKDEWNAIVYPISTNPFGLVNVLAYCNLLKIPLAGCRVSSSASVNRQGQRGRYRSSDQYDSGNASAWGLWLATEGQTPAIVTQADYKAGGFSIRPFKDEPVVPDNSRVVLYQKWEPGENTYAYYPLTSNANDYSGNNRNLTADSAITYSGSMGASLPNSNHTGLLEPFNITSSGTWTFSWRQNTLGVRDTDARGIDIYWGSTSANRRLLTAWSSSVQKFWRGSSDSYQIITSTQNANKRYLNTITLNNGVLKIYVNGKYLGTGDVATGYTSSYFRRGQEFNNGANRQLYGYLKDIIVENKVWADQEVLDYYNNIKGTYGS